jgi:hypothetical protein
MILSMALAGAVELPCRRPFSVDRAALPYRAIADRSGRLQLVRNNVPREVVFTSSGRKRNDALGALTAIPRRDTFDAVCEVSQRLLAHLGRPAAW